MNPPTLLQQVQDNHSSPLFLFKKDGIKPFSVSKTVVIKPIKPWLNSFLNSSLDNASAKFLSKIVPVKPKIVAVNIIRPCVGALVKLGKMTNAPMTPAIKPMNKLNNFLGKLSCFIRSAHSVTSAPKNAHPIMIRYNSQSGSDRSKNGRCRESCSLNAIVDAADARTVDPLVQRSSNDCLKASMRCGISTSLFINGFNNQITANT